MIVNADDFGFSDTRNAAVARAFDEGLISSATLMATRSAFDGACELVRMCSRPSSLRQAIDPCVSR